MVTMVGPLVDPWGPSRWELADGSLGGLNIALAATDRQVARGLGDVCAMRFLGPGDHVEDLTYGRLTELSARFATGLRTLGLGPGDLVASLCGRQSGLYVALLGTLRARSAFSPLFASFGPEPVRQRLAAGRARALVTTPTLYRRTVAQLRQGLPDLAWVILLGDPGDVTGPGVVPFDAMVAQAPLPAERTDAGETALVHFTSGTTGQPKGAVHVHEAAVAHHATARSVLGLREGDVYWCTADPGWVTGISYGVVGPLTCGVTCVVDEAEFDARRWYEVLERERVTVWYTAPTALRMLKRAGDAPLAGRDLSRLREVFSVGEPLNAEVVLWGERAWNRTIRDTWWQTETGAIMIAAAPPDPVRPGSIGRPVMGVEAAVARRDEQGQVVTDVDGRPVFVGTDESGELVLRAPWPSMMRGYLSDEERSAACFRADWYLTGDLVRRDIDGWFWFVGRGDDVITSAGHLIGPFEVESVLLEHPEVAEAGVIGVPDDVVGELVQAHVSLVPGAAADDELRRAILAHARRRLGPAVAPRVIVFEQDLPHTRSGKVMRRLLRARALGLPEGDTSTLEPVP